MFDRSGPGWWSDAAQDVGFAFRLTGQAKGVTALRMVILGIGIGVSTALYSLLPFVWGGSLQPRPRRARRRKGRWSRSG